jgi:hypothetical protein
MSRFDNQLQSIRRMWTYRFFVWGIRLIIAGVLLLVVSACGADAIGPWGSAIALAGVALSVPFRIQAHTKLDIPYMSLFRQALHEALGDTSGQRFMIRIPVKKPAVLRAVERMNAEPPVTSPEETLTALRRSRSYRASVWGYRLMMLSVLLWWGGCIGVEAQTSGDRRPPEWLVSLATMPIFAFLVGMVLTLPMSWQASTRLRIAAGRIILQALKDAFNPTFF